MAQGRCGLGGSVREACGGGGKEGTFNFFLPFTRVKVLFSGLHVQVEGMLLVSPHHKYPPPPPPPPSRLWQSWYDD